jgi:NAD(P)-dependent dehydrogenase (short-subunit alcohol dehydrogenase family)
MEDAMKDLAGKTAVVTGAASGIGLGIARALAGAGMNVALADIEAAPLDQACSEIEASGVKVAGLVLDVANRAAVYDAAVDVEKWFGRVDVLVNNAGVLSAGSTLDAISDDEYDWVIGVNLMGVINGIKAFVPRIRRQGEGGHVVNTSSIIGMFTIPLVQHGLYAATKFAVVALSECLRGDLADDGIGVSVLCPRGVQTNLFQSGRNRPERHGGAFARDDDHPVLATIAAGINPDEVGRRVLRAIEHDELYIFTHVEERAHLEARHRELMAAFDETERYLAQETASHDR